MDNASSRRFLHLLEEETIFGLDDAAFFSNESSRNLPEPLTFRTAPEGPNYHLKAAKAGLRAEKRDNGGLGFHEAPVKFP